MRGQEKKKYYLLQQKEIEEIKKLNYKPSLLMHSCCGVCVSYPSLYLSEFFDLTLYYNNDNIYPESEYVRRFNELEKLISIYNETFNTNIKIVKTEFDGLNYLKKLQPLKDCKEKGTRCHLCYSLRMKQAIDYAVENHFDYFTTVMTVSRQKDSNVLNEIGARLTKGKAIKYFFSDFKKDNGNEKTNELANKYNLYHQQYCGCYYSYIDYQFRKGKQRQNNDPVK